jgi:hypothetical protein
MEQANGMNPQEAPQRIDDETLGQALETELQDAITFADSELAPMRAAATHYYQAREFGDEEQGRSAIVMPVVRDTVRATLPSLMRIFFGSQRVVEFSSGTPTSGDFAEDATTTVNYVFTRQNPGYQIAWAAFKDALVRKTGWVKYWWDDSLKVSYRTFSGVSEQQLEQALATLDKTHEKLEVREKVQVGEQQTQTVGVDANGSPVPVMQAVPVYEYKIDIVSRKPVNQVRVAAVPPDEILVCRDASATDGARLIAHRTKKTRGELVAMGVTKEQLNAAPMDDYDRSTNIEVIARQPTEQTVPDRDSSGLTWDQVKVAYYECYYNVDVDGDGISELRKVCRLGLTGPIVYNEPIDEVPLALFCPDPEPHVVFGLSQADYVMDLQLVYSHIWRDILDSLKASIFPRTAYVEGQVNVDDVLNTEIGAAIRMRAPGMVQTLDVPFSGDKAFPLLGMLDDVREQRTGIKNSTISTSGDALQSTTQIAAAATVTAAQAQVELIARIFAETGMKRVFRGILKLLTQHQDHAMQFKLNGRDWNVNPADWSPDMEAIVNTALGTGTQDQKLAVLSSVAAAQKEVLMTIGAENPLCSLQEFYNTQVSMLELAGFRDTHRYWRNPTISKQQGIGIPSPKPSPEQVLAQAQVEIERAKGETESLKIILQDDRERDKNEADMFLRAEELRARYGAQVNLGLLKAIVDHGRNQATLAKATAGAESGE